MVTVPLIALAILSVYAGAAYIGGVVFGPYFGDSIVIAQDHTGLAEMREDWHGVVAFMVHGLIGLPLDLALAGIAVAWYLYIKRPDLPAKIATRLSGLYTLLMNNYYFDKFNDWFFAGGFRRLATSSRTWVIVRSSMGFSSMAARASSQPPPYFCGTCRRAACTTTRLP